MKLEVGQKLWYVSNSARLGAPYEIAVTAVGRKWAKTEQDLGGGRTLAAHKIEIANLAADGGKYPSPGRAYLSREAWEIAKETDRLWSKLRRGLSYKISRTNDCTAEKIREAADALGVPLGDD